MIRRLRALFVATEYGPDEQIDPSDFDWAALSQSAAGHFKSAPGVSCMLGPMALEAKARKVPQQRAKRQPPGELKTTQKVDVAQEKVPVQPHPRFPFSPRPALSPLPPTLPDAYTYMHTHILLPTCCVPLFLRWVHTPVQDHWCHKLLPLHIPVDWN